MIQQPRLEYVRWAPKNLIDVYEDYLRFPEYLEEDGTDPDVLRRMLTYTDMGEAWKELRKEHYARRMIEKDEGIRWDSWSKRPVNEDQDPFEYLAMKISLLAEDVASGPRFTGTRGEVGQELKKIAKAARDFAAIVRRTPFDKDTQRFFPAATLFAMMRHFDKSFLDTAIESAGEEIKADEFKKERFLASDGNGFGFFRDEGCQYQFRRAEDGKRLDDEPYIFIDSLTEKGFRFWFKHAFPYGMPRMSILATAVAEEAEKKAAEIKKDRSFLVPKPNDSEAKRIFAIRMMATWFRFWFGGYLRGTLASIVSAVLDDPNIEPRHIDDATDPKRWVPCDDPRAMHLLSDAYWGDYS